MSFPRYSAYKDSGVAWLGEVPEHWGASQSRRMFSVRSEPAHSSDRMLTASQKYGVLFQSDFVELEGRRVVEVIMGFENLKHVEPDDFIISMRSFQGGIEWCRLRGSTSFHYVMLTPIKNVYPPYFAYALKSSSYIQVLRTTTDLIRDGQELRFSNFAQVHLPVVPREEQAAIATFLDRETAKIDALVSEQQRLIELLKEKRQAVISHVVTKGLNPDAPMKDSGVEWLGEVPAHWEVIKMKWVAKMESGHTPDKKVPEYWEGGDIPWVSLNDTSFLRDNDYITDTAYAVTRLGIENSSAHLLPERSVVFSRDATIGRCAITTRPMAVSQHFIAWVCGSRVIPEFLLLRLRSMTGELDRLTTGATLKTIGMPEVRTLVTPVPSLLEQRAIIDWVENQAKRLDALTDTAERAIELLQERRTALISAAVTGQIDVREVTA